MTRKLLGLSDKIAALSDEDAEMINGYLKILKSNWRITLSDTEQMKRAGQSMKKGLNKILGALKE